MKLSALNKLYFLCLFFEYINALVHKNHWALFGKLEDNPYQKKYIYKYIYIYIINIYILYIYTYIYIIHIYIMYIFNAYIHILYMIHVWLWYRYTHISKIQMGSIETFSPLRHILVLRVLKHFKYKNCLIFWSKSLNQLIIKL